MHGGTMSAQVFILTGSRKGATIRLMRRYTFVDGVYVAETEEIAKKVQKNLVGFYGCKQVSFEQYQAALEAAKAASTSEAPKIAPATTPEVIAAAQSALQVDSPTPIAQTARRPVSTKSIDGPNAA